MSVISAITAVTGTSISTVSGQPSISSSTHTPDSGCSSGCFVTTSRLHSSGSSAQAASAGQGGVVPASARQGRSASAGSRPASASRGSIQAMRCSIRRDGGPAILRALSRIKEPPCPATPVARAACFRRPFWA